VYNENFIRQGEAAKLAPIGAVMLLEAWIFEALPQHLSGKRDQKFQRA